MSQLSVHMGDAMMVVVGAGMGVKVEGVDTFEQRNRSQCRDSCHNLYDDYYYEHDVDTLYRCRETFAINNSILMMDLDHMLQKIKKIEEELIQICQSEDDAEMVAASYGPPDQNCKIYVEQIDAVEVEDKYIGTLNSEPPTKKMRR